jgi:hypothetical protein
VAVGVDDLAQLLLQLERGQQPLVEQIAHRVVLQRASIGLEQLGTGPRQPALELGPVQLRGAEPDDLADVSEAADELGDVADGAIGFPSKSMIAKESPDRRT